MPDLSATAWDARYESKDTPWDLQGPTPEFALLLEEKQFFRPKLEVMVPGAGRGNDAVHLAKAGLQVSAVDLSPTALDALLGLAFVEKTTVHCFQENFFEIARQGYHKERYDLLLEYTFYCAIDPTLRDSYVEAAAAILKQGGILVGLFFPTNGRAGGPPFAVTKEEVEKLFQKYFTLEIQTPRRSVKPREGQEFLGIFRKK